MVQNKTPFCEYEQVDLSHPLTSPMEHGPPVQTELIIPVIIRTGPWIVKRTYMHGNTLLNAAQTGKLMSADIGTTEMFLHCAITLMLLTHHILRSLCLSQLLAPRSHPFFNGWPWPLQGGEHSPQDISIRTYHLNHSINYCGICGNCAKEKERNKYLSLLRKNKNCVGCFFKLLIHSP